MLRHKMGEDYTEPKGYPDFDEFRMIEVYTRVAKPEKKGGNHQVVCYSREQFASHNSYYSFWYGY